MYKMLSGYAEGSYFSADVDMDNRMQYLSTNGHYYYVLGQQDDLLATYRLPDGSIISHELDDDAEAAFMVMSVDTDTVYAVLPLETPMSEVRASMAKHPDFYMGKLIDTFETADENMVSDSMEYRIIGTAYSDVPGSSGTYDKTESLEYEHHVQSFEHNERAAQKWLLENHAEHWFGASFVPVKEGSTPYINPVPEYYESVYQTRDRNEILAHLAQEFGVETLGFSDGRKIEVEPSQEPYRTVTYVESTGKTMSAKQLTLGGSCNIENPDDAIAKELLHMMAAMRMETRDGAGNVVGTEALQHIPEFWDIQQMVARGEDIHVDGGLINPEHPEFGSSISLDYNGQDRTVTKSFSAGQFEYDGEFQVQEIERENVRFIPVETFYTSDGAVPVQRFYTKPFTSEADARKVLTEMKPHEIQGVQSTCELMVADMEDLEDSDWYESNMRCVAMVEASDGALSWDENFAIWAETHAAKLEQASPEDMFIPETAQIPVTEQNVLAVCHAMEDYIAWCDNRANNISPSEDPQIEDAILRGRDCAVEEHGDFMCDVLPSAGFDLSQIPIPGYEGWAAQQTSRTTGMVGTYMCMSGFNNWLKQSGNLEAVKEGCYGLSKADTKSAYYDKQDYYKGTFGDKTVSFKRMLNGRMLSKEECEQLCSGQTVKLDGIPKKAGGTYSGYGTLQEKSFTAHGREIKYYGVGISFKQPGKTAEKSDFVKKEPESEKKAHEEPAKQQDADDLTSGKPRFFSNKYGQKYCAGVWNGNKIRFKPMYKGVSVSSAECQKLLAGETVELEHVGLNGEPLTSYCQLANMVYKDRKTQKEVRYVGIRATGYYDKDGKAVSTTRGHEFDDIDGASGPGTPEDGYGMD